MIKHGLERITRSVTINIRRKGSKEILREIYPTPFQRRDCFPRFAKRGHNDTIMRDIRMIPMILFVWLYVFFLCVSVCRASETMSVYYDATSANTPAYSTYPVVSDWSSEKYATSVGQPANGFYVLKSCPKRNEKILAVQDSNGNLTVQIWNGTIWGTVKTLSTDVTTNYRAFDVGYEQVSGDAVVVYRKNSGTNKVYYSIWNGSSWTTDDINTGLLLDGDALAWIRAESNPKNDEIVLVTLCVSSHVYAAVWNGNGWGNQQALETVGVSSVAQQGFDVVYTSSMNYAMVVWNENGQSNPRYCQWFSTATSWGSKGTISEITTTGTFRWIRLANNPKNNSNEIIFGSYDTDYDINIATWNGSWGKSFEVDVSAAQGVSYNFRCFDINYENSSGRGMVAYATRTSPAGKPKYQIWTGAEWLAVAFAIDVGPEIRWLKLDSDKDTSSNEIMMFTSDIDSDINVQRWTGSSWGSLKELETESSIEKECFSAAYSYPQSSPDTKPPNNISNLTALTGSDDGIIVLNWTSPGDDGTVGNITVGEYWLKYSTNSISNETDFTNVQPQWQIKNSTDTTPQQPYSTTITGLNPGTSYYFALKYKDDTGNWASWSTGTFVNVRYSTSACDLPPAAPQNLTSIAGNSEIKLQWTAVLDEPDLDFYRIYCDSQPPAAVEWFVVGTTPSIYTSFTHKLLANNTMYYYIVKAVDKGNTNDGYSSYALESDSSTIVSTMPYAGAPPLSPSNFTGSAVSTYSINWTWIDNSSYEQGFEIHSSTDGLMVSSVTIAVNRSSHTQTGLSANTSSYFQHIHSVNDSGLSLQTTAAVFPVYTLARAATGLVVVDVTTNSVSLQWSANYNPDGTRFGLSQSTNTEFTGTAVSTFVYFSKNLTATTTIAFNLQPTTTYYFRAWAYNNNEIETDFESPVSTMTKTLALNGTPQWSSNCGALSTTEIYWEWIDNSTNEDGYRLINSTSGDNVSGDLAEDTIFYTKAGLTPNTSYAYYVQAFNTIGTADSTTPKTTIYYTMANDPTDLTIVQVWFSSITISWTIGLGGATCYGIQRSTGIVSPVNWQYIKTFADNWVSTTFSDTGLLQNTTYWYQVCAYNGDGIGSGAVEISTVTLTTETLTDAILSIITHTPITEINIVGDIIIASATVVDDRAISFVKLFYRKKGETDFVSSDFIPAPASNIYSGYSVIPVSSVTTVGLEYYISASDGINVSSTSLSSVNVSRICQRKPDANLVVEALDGNPNDGSAKIQFSEALDLTVKIEQKDSLSENSYGIEEIANKNNNQPVATYSFGPANILINKLCYITLLYFDLDNNGIVETEYGQITDVNEAELSVFFWDGVKWRFFGGKPDYIQNTFTIKTNKLGKYALFVKGISSNKAAPDEKFITSFTPATFGEKAEEVGIYDASGLEVIKLSKENFYGGVITWNGTDENAKKVESGVYIFKIKTTDGKTKYGTIVLAK